VRRDEAKSGVEAARVATDARRPAVEVSCGVAGFFFKKKILLLIQGKFL
jgi:hypothetical protein